MDKGVKDIKESEKNWKCKEKKTKQTNEMKLMGVKYFFIYMDRSYRIIKPNK